MNIERDERGTVLLGGSAARRLGGSAARRLGGSAAARTVSSTHEHMMAHLETQRATGLQEPGSHGHYRNPRAHAARLDSAEDRLDFYDAFSLFSYVHRRLDRAGVID